MLNFSDDIYFQVYLNKFIKTSHLPEYYFIFSADIFDQVAPAIEEQGLDCEVLGGGRIIHEANKKKIEIFGYSQVSIHCTNRAEL